MKININKDKLLDIAKRAVKTFFQAFLASVSVDKFFGVTNYDTLKKVFISILTAALAAGICAVWNMLRDMIDSYFAGKGAGTMSFDAFIKKYYGKATDYDGAYGAQCVDLIKMYLKYVFGITPKSIGNAHAYYDNFALHSYLTKNFIRIKNTPEFIPMKGDICVFGKSFSKSHKCGHIGIAADDSTLKLVRMYDQNATGNNDALKISTYDYNRNFLGVLRPIHREEIDGTKLYRVKKAVNVREGAGTGSGRIMYPMFTAYEQEQVLLNGGKASDNDFPKGMLIVGYETKGSWVKISADKDRWVHRNYLEEE